MPLLIPGSLIEAEADWLCEVVSKMYDSDAIK